MDQTNVSIDGLDIETVTTDVLVVGGGFAGTWAALRAAQMGADVVLLEKAHVSRSGASTMSGGVTTAPLPGEDLEPWVREIVEFGGYTANEAWVRQVLSLQVDRLQDYISWGVPIMRADDGTIQRRKSRGMIEVRCLQYTPKRAIETLRQKVIEAGARIIDRVTVEELLTTDGEYPTAGRVCGAVAIHTRTAVPMVVRAKTVIIASGQQSIKGTRPIDNCTSDGLAMAYRVGARCVDLEFASSGTFSVFTVAGEQFHFGNYNVAVAHGARLLNSQGERFMARYDPDRLERSELVNVVAAFVKELMDGRGPVYLDLTVCGEDFWRTLHTVRSAHAILSSDIPDPRLHPLMIEPHWSFALSSGRGGLKIDLDCKTSVGGLYAAGAAAQNEGLGFHSSAGMPTAFAKVTGHRAGELAAIEAQGISDDGLPAVHAQAVVDRVLAPLGARGPFSVDSIHEYISDMLGSPVNLLILNEQRIRESLSALEDLLGVLDQVEVGSPHELIKYHEARNLLQVVTLIFTAMLDRTESRANFYRDDYPETDDRNWLCLHTVERTATGPLFQRVEVPEGLNHLVPPPPESRTPRLGPVAAILRGEFENVDLASIHRPAS